MASKLPYYSIYQPEDGSYPSRVIINDTIYNMPSTSYTASGLDGLDECLKWAAEKLGQSIIPAFPHKEFTGRHTMVEGGGDVESWLVNRAVTEVDKNKVRAVAITAFPPAGPFEDYSVGIYPSNMSDYQNGTNRHIIEGINNWSSNRTDTAYWSAIKTSADASYNLATVLSMFFLAYYWNNSLNDVFLLNHTFGMRVFSTAHFNSLGDLIQSSSLPIKNIYFVAYHSPTPDNKNAMNAQIDINNPANMADLSPSALGYTHAVAMADPLSGGGYSGGANDNTAGVGPDGTNHGGDGLFDLTDQDDDVPESSLPPATSSIVGAGFGSVYCDTGTNVRSLAGYMWTHADDIIANLKKIMSNPIDSILALHIVPVVPSVGASSTVYLGNVSTSVSMTTVSNPYVRKRLGTLTVPKYWGTALDFNPFTQVQIYLPYIGYKPLNVDEVMGSSIELYYDIDVTTGACVAHLKITRTDPLTGSTKTVDAYDFPGNCAMQIPVTATNYQGLYSAIVGAVTAIAGAVAAGTAGGAAGHAVSEASRGMMLAQSLSTAANAMYNGGSKIRVEKSGSLTGNHGYLSCQYAFLERTTPRQSLAPTYRNVKGYPSNMSLQLSECRGFTQVEDINLEGIDCTGEELGEIERLLKGGVLF